MQHRYAFASAVVAALMSLQCGVVHALSIDLPLGDDLRLSGTLNTTVTAGVAMRMESRSRSLVGKANYDPGVCGRVDANGQLPIHTQLCQGLFRERTILGAQLANTPGQLSINSDDGDLTYERYDMMQTTFKLTRD